jgi:hypothetical protein
LRAAVLDCAPPGVVDATPTHVTCRLAPPLDLVGTFVVANHWRALGRIGAFSRVAPCGVVVRHRPQAMNDAVSMACSAGLGLAVIEADRPQDLVNPSTFPIPTTGRRRVLEVVFGQWRRQATGMPANLHHAWS